MQSDNTQRVLFIDCNIPADLGSIEANDPTAQLEKSTAKDSLHAGDIYLRATLNEMVQIIRLCKSLEENHRELLRDTKAQYDKWVYLLLAKFIPNSNACFISLNRRKKELEFLEKRKSIIKLFKFMEIRRAKRAFRENTRELWISTRVPSLINPWDK